MAIQDQTNVAPLCDIRISELSALEWVWNYFLVVTFVVSISFFA